MLTSFFTNNIGKSLILMRMSEMNMLFHTANRRDFMIGYVVNIAPFLDGE